MKSLVFCEYGSIRNCNFRSEDFDTRWVVYDPESHYQLIRSGIPSEAILTDADCITKERLGDLVRVSARLQRWLRQETTIPEAEDLEWSIAEYLLWYTNLILNYCLWILDSSSIWIDSLHPDELRAYHPTVVSNEGPRLSAANDDFLPILLTKIASARGLEFRPVRQAPTDFMFGRVRVIYSKAKGVSRSLGLDKQRLKPSSGFKGYTGLESGSILYTSGGYRMDTIVDRIKSSCQDSPAYLLDGQTGTAFDGSFELSKVARPSIRDDQFLGALQRRLEILANQVEQQDKLFSHNGISFADLLAKKILEGLTPCVMDFYSRAQNIESFLKTHRPKLVISSGDRDEDRIVGMLCQRYQIPSVMIFHGSLNVPRSELENIEIGEQTIGKWQSPFSHFALQSPLMEKHARYYPSESIPVRTGPLLWGSRVRREAANTLRRNMIGEKKVRVIVHSSTPKGGRAYPRFFMYENYNEYVQSIKDLAEAIEQIPDTHLVVKFRPSEAISTESLRCLVPFSNKVTLSVDEPFLDILGFADLLVSFTSTTIEEALINEVPVLLYGPQGRYHYLKPVIYQPGKQLPISTVYVVQNPHDLRDGVEGILDRIKSLKADAFKQFRFDDHQISMPIEKMARNLCNQTDLAST